MWLISVAFSRSVTNILQIFKYVTRLDQIEFDEGQLQMEFIIEVSNRPNIVEALRMSRLGIFRYQKKKKTMP